MYIESVYADFFLRKSSQRKEHQVEKQRLPNYLFFKCLKHWQRFASTEVAERKKEKEREREKKREREKERETCKYKYS